MGATIRGTVLVSVRGWCHCLLMSKAFPIAVAALAVLALLPRVAEAQRRVTPAAKHVRLSPTIRRTAPFRMSFGIRMRGLSPSRRSFGYSGLSRASGYGAYAYPVAPYGDGAGTASVYGPYAPTSTSSYGTAARPGGLSFAIVPVDAAVFVDGTYVGTTHDFTAAAPLQLAPGRHHFDLRAQGYQTTTFDVSITPGQIIPYQGTLTIIR